MKGFVTVILLGSLALQVLASDGYIFNAQKNVNYELNKALEVNDVITAWGVYKDHSTSKFSVNIRGANNLYLLHVDFRPYHDVVVLNSHTTGWQTEIRPAFSRNNLQANKIFSIRIEVHDNEYRIFYNGNELAKRFPQRQDIAQAAHVTLHGGSNGFQWSALHLPDGLVAGPGIPFPTSTAVKNYVERELVPGDIITAWGIYATASSKFNVNLMKESGDFMIHVDFRPPPHENKVVLNSKVGSWQREIRTILPTFVNGRAFKVEVKCLLDEFEIFVDGKVLGSRFPYRDGFSLSDVSYVWLLGGSNGMIWTDLSLPPSAVIGVQLQGVSAIQSSTGWSGAPERAIDGNTNGQWGASSCQHSQGSKNNWWMMTLAGNTAVNKVIIYNRVDCCSDRINRAKVYVGDVFCGEVTYEAGKVVYDIECGGTVGSTVAVVQNDNYLTLCEVKVFGLPSDETPLLNIAPGFPTWQSSEGWSGAPGRATDLRTNGMWGDGACTHSGTAGFNMWKVDLIDKYEINKVVIHNRLDCCQDRLDGAQVYVHSYLCGAIEYVAGKNVYVVDCGGKVGSAIKITQEGEYLTLCEVEILARPSEKVGRLINVAASGTATQDSTGWEGVPERAIDGHLSGSYSDEKTCSHNGDLVDGWWNLEFPEPTAIEKVIIYNREDCCSERINNVKVYADDMLCGTIKYKEGQTVYKIGCSSDEAEYILARNIRITQADGTYLTLCEVQVLSDPNALLGNLVNLAYLKPTHQSSVGWGGVPSRGVDGKESGKWSAGTCTHTNGAGWWSVDLEDNYAVEKIWIRNRVDCCSERINDVKVYVGDILCGTIEYNRLSYSYELECGDGNGIVGNSVKIVNDKTHLTLCEVKVYGGGEPIIEEGSAVYKVELTTGDVNHAGTDDWIYMTIVGTKGETKEVGIDDPSKNDMVRGATDTHEWTLLDVGDIKCVKFRIDGTDGWNAQRVVIYNKDELRFDSGEKVGIWLDTNGAIQFCDTEEAEYRVELTTADVTHAGTDNWIFMTIMGTEGETLEVAIDDPGKDDMVRGATDTHEWTLKNVGEIFCVQFRIAGTDGWNAQRVVIYNKDELRFDSGELGIWLDDNETKKFCVTKDGLKWEPFSLNKQAVLLTDFSDMASERFFVRFPCSDTIWFKLFLRGVGGAQSHIELYSRTKGNIYCNEGGTRNWYSGQKTDFTISEEIKCESDGTNIILVIEKTDKRVTIKNRGKVLYNQVLTAPQGANNNDGKCVLPTAVVKTQVWKYTDYLGLAVFGNNIPVNLAAQRTCFVNDFDYGQADIKRVPSVDTAAACLALCGETDGCVSVAFVPANGDCWLKNKKYGQNPKPKVGVVSANLACGTVSNVKEVIGEKSASNDDAQSRATCPVGFTVSYCEAKSGEVHDKCDGAFVDPNNGAVCVAVNGGSGNGAIARAVCSQTGQVADPCNGPNLPKYKNLHSRGATPSLECPAGYEQIVCNARSPWRGKLTGKDVNTKGVIPNDKACAVSGCTVSGWCEVTAVCKLIDDADVYAAAVCPSCDGYHCGDGEVCEMLDVDDDGQDAEQPVCVERQTGCDNNDRCGDGHCVAVGSDGYACECVDGFEFNKVTGSCIPVHTIWRTVFGEEAVGDDAISYAECEAGEVVMRCHTYGAPSAADGVYITTGEDGISKCIARASHSRKYPIIAIAYCGSRATMTDPCTQETIHSTEYRFSSADSPSISCPGGYFMESCIFHSPWTQSMTDDAKEKVSSIGSVAVNSAGSCSVENCLKNPTERTFCKLTAICTKLTGDEYVRSACPTCDQVRCPGDQVCELVNDLPVCLPRIPGGCETDNCGPGTCIEDGPNYSCECHSGFFFNELECQDVDECAELPCGNGVCSNSAGSYSCDCNDGYENARGTCIDVDECADSPCSGTERCSNIEGSYICDCLDTFIRVSDVCVCADGFENESGKCVDVNECDDATSCGKNQDCFNTKGNFHCECFAGFEPGSNGVCKDFTPGDCDVRPKNDDIKSFKGKRVVVKLVGEVKKVWKKYATISWLKNNEHWNPKSDGKSRFNGFILRKFDAEDAGLYVGNILIEKSETENYKCSVSLTISLKEGSAEIEIENRDLLSENLKAGNGMAIMCDVKLTNVPGLDNKNDPNNVNWYKVNLEGEDRKMVDDDDVNINKNRKDGTYRLWFINPKATDSGTYKCEFNQQGVTASADVSVIWE